MSASRSDIDESSEQEAEARLVSKGVAPRRAGSPSGGLGIVDDYRRALEAVAAEAGVAPGEFEQAVKLAATRLKLTPDCVTLDDIECFPTLESLPVSRQDHVAGCGECQAFFSALTPPTEEVERFVRVAVSPESCNQPHLNTSPLAAHLRH